MDNSAIIQALIIQRDIIKMLVDHHNTNTFNPHEKERLNKLLSDLDEQLRSIQ